MPVLDLTNALVVEQKQVIAAWIQKLVESLKPDWRMLTLQQTDACSFGSEVFNSDMWSRLCGLHSAIVHTAWCTFDP